jgi:hypothetical protein
VPHQKLAIKVEIDTQPPAGGLCERRVVTRHVTFLLQHYDLPSLLAGKLNAAITRNYAKGRDWYDLVWYLSQSPQIEPNLQLLQNALDQTRGIGRDDAHDWRALARSRLGALDMNEIARDVAPFLERPQDCALLTLENLMGLLRSAKPAQGA